jgi:hypothetical protein
MRKAVSILGAFALVAGAFAVPAPSESGQKEREATEAAAAKLAIAFEGNKEVATAKFKFEAVQKGVHCVFACNEFAVQEDGRVKLTPGYMARCYKDGTEAVTAPHYFLTFDRKVSNVAEMRQAAILVVECPSSRHEVVPKASRPGAK